MIANRNLKKRFITDNKVTMDDGCSLDSDPASIRYKKFSVMTEPDFIYHQDVFSCARRFVWSQLGRDTWEFMDNLQLICRDDLKNDALLSIAESHDRILFLGDSVIRQQYYTFLCMLDPTLTPQGMTSYSAVDKFAKVTWKHVRADGGETSISYQVFGRGFDPTDVNLYREAFPKAILTFSRKDAIVMDASRHYNQEAASLYYQSLNFIAQASPRAQIYYMEPTPMEWPTSNGFYVSSCKGMKCSCEALGKERLIGKGTIAKAAVESAMRQHNGSIPDLPIPEILARIYPDLKPVNQRLCLPSCVPATWRVDLARTAFRNSTKVTLVPTFFQLISQENPMTLTRVDDCTHRSFAGIVLMNQQLLRSMNHSRTTFSL